ncbi:MAG: putative lipid II flippase FtsW [Actinobacteria bacterium]|jgi:cell division protein FtsW|nr:putative lipid II flippase FtsW [Actinomycetota bacterium]
MTAAGTSTTAGPAGQGTGRLARLRARWHPGAWNSDATALTVITAVLLLVGLVMSYSASIVDAAEAGDPFAIFRRQLVWATLGVPAFVVAANLDHRIWRRLAWPLIIASVIGLIAVLVPGVGVTRFGSTRWLGFGPMVVQPSEIAKLAALLWVADVLERKRPRDGSLHTTAHLNVPAIPLLFLLAVLVLAQPDLGTTILLGLIIASVLWVEGLPGKYVAVGAVGALSAIAVLAVVAPYRLRRITGWLEPEADPMGAGYQLIQSKLALGEGGVWGVGLGSSRAKWNWVPNPETDFIFAIIGEELGLVGATFVLGLFAALLFVGLRIAYAAQEGFGRTVAFGITAWIAGQALINIGTVTGVLPITGVTLPLVSVGGSSLVSTLVALGLLVAVARATPPPTSRLRREAGQPRLIHRSGDAS